MARPAPPSRPGPTGPRRRVSQQRYAVRRLGAVAALGLIVFGAVRGIGELAGGEAQGQASGLTSTAPAGPTTAGGAAASPSTAVATTAPPTTEEENTGPPTEDNKADVLIIGDSDAGTFGPYLDMIVDDWGIVDVDLDYIVSSGLARPDFHNWPAHLRDTLASSDPEIIIVTFGGNDAQGLTEPSGNVVAGMPNQDTEDWTAEYVRRVTEMMDIMLEDPDRAIIWVGIPNAVSPEFTERLRIQDRAVRQALEAFPDAVFVDTWNRFDGRNGGIAELVVDPRDGAAKPVRQSDGFHLNEDGAEILAIDISVKIKDALRAMGAEI